MSSNSPNGGPTRSHPRRTPQSTWQPEHGIVFTASPQPASGTSFSSSTSSVSEASSPSLSQQYGTYSPQQPIVFSRQSSLSFGQAPSYDHAPSFGQAPTFGQAPSFGSFGSFGQQRSFDSASVFGQRSFERATSFERSPSFGNTPSSQTMPVFGQPSTFGQTSTFEQATSFTLSQSPVFGQSSQTASTSFSQSLSQQSNSPPRLSSSQSFGQPSERQTFSSQPARPMFSFSSQSSNRFMHSSSNQQSSSSVLQSQSQPPTALELEQETTAADIKADENGKSEETAKTKAEEDTTEVEDQPPVTDLDFNMTKALFDKARNAAPGTPESYWSYTLYRKNPAPVKATDDDSGNVSDTESVKSDSHSVYSSVTKSGGESERIKVHYCKSKETTERVCAEYFANEPMLGFDLEWMANAARWDGPRKNVCLLQLSSPSRIGLFHLSLFPTRDFMTPTLRKILESPDIIKTGVFIRGDATRLLNHLSVNMRGLMELSHLHRLVKYSMTGEYHLINKRLVSLADQVKENLKLPMFKGQDVRAGNWSRPLRMDQIIYSASDAYASVQLFAVLEKKRLSLDPIPPRPAFAELNKPIKLAAGVGVASETEDAADDAEQPVQDGDQSKDEAVPLTSDIIADAEGTLLVEKEATDNDSQSTVSPASVKRKSTSADDTNKKKNPRAPAVPAAFTDTRIVASHQWMGQYRETKMTPVKATAAALRAYHLWHSNADLNAEAIAAMLRDPPLKTTTVVGYVLSTIQLEKLPYDKDRCRADLMEQLPHKVRLSKYRGLAKACNYDLTAPDPASTQS